MKKKIILFVFEDFAGEGSASALNGISKSCEFEIQTLALKKSPVRSQGGLNVIPDLDFLSDDDLDDIENWNTALLILPGGSGWRTEPVIGVAPLVRHCMKNGIPVAAIGEATVFLADLGLLDQIPHTSDSAEYLQHNSGAYRGWFCYRESAAFRTRTLITAGRLESRAFALEIFKALDVLPPADISGWASIPEVSMTGS